MGQDSRSGLRPGPGDSGTDSRRPALRPGSRRAFSLRLGLPHRPQPRSEAWAGCRPPAPSGLLSHHRAQVPKPPGPPESSPPRPPPHTLAAPTVSQAEHHVCTSGPLPTLFSLLECSPAARPGSGAPELGERSVNPAPFTSWPSGSLRAQLLGPEPSLAPGASAMLPGGSWPTCRRRHQIMAPLLLEPCWLFLLPLVLTPTRAPPP